MAVKIKLKRMGKIRAPYYRIVVADSRTKRDGRAIEEIGKYHPKSDPSFIHVESERAQYWLSVGAQPTDPVRRILEITGDWQRFRGEPGAEGTLRTAAPKTTRSERFAEAVGQTRTAGGETTPKGRTKKSDAEPGQAGKQDPAAKRKPPVAAKTGKTEKADAKAPDQAETAAEPVKAAEDTATEPAKPAEATAKPAEAAAEAAAEPAEAVAEATAESGSGD